MVKTISQETFDNAVKENIEDLGMEPEEALQDAVMQFEKQGVDLTNIVKKLSLSEDKLKTLSESLKLLENASNLKNNQSDVLNHLETIKSECNKGIELRVAAGKGNAYNIIIGTLNAFKGDLVVEKACLKTLTALMTKQPDLLDDQGIESMFLYLNHEDDELKRLVMKWIKECCIMHEMNRQKIFEKDIVRNIKECTSERYPELLRDTLAVCRTLVLDDDVRVEFGKAHEHARILATEILCLLLGLLSRFRTEEVLINDLILTISSLLVRTEFCKKVESSGGLELIGDIMQYFKTNDKIVRQCLKLLKALAGNDDCKARIVQKNLAPVITDALTKNIKSLTTSKAGLACVAALCLRSPDNSKAFYDAGICPVIVEIMKLYPDDKQIQKTASWAIRNMVSRSRYQNERFLELGIEPILQKNLKKFKEIEYDTKAALRDLGCRVNLKEEWTGKGGALTSGLSNVED